MSEFTKKTIIGVVSAILAVLVLLGVLTPEQSSAAGEAVAPLIEHIGGAILGVLAIFGVFTGSKEQ